MGGEMDLNRKIRDFEAHFRELYIDAIPLLYKRTSTKKATGHYLSFSAVFSAIECLAAMLLGTRCPPGDRFEAFVKGYFVHDPRYPRNSAKLWKLRCSLAHSFSCGGTFVLTHENPKHHFYEHHGTIILNAESFFKDSQTAADRYFQDLQSAKGVRQKFAAAICETGVIRGCVQLPELPQLPVLTTASNIGTAVNHIISPR
jgi:hypothetical protein